jgi:hypothetical protein
MIQPLAPETLDRVREAARREGAFAAQMLLHLLERVDAMEATQQQQFLAELNMPLTEADRVDLGLPSAELEHDDGINQPAPEAAPVATDRELLDKWDAHGTALEAFRSCYDLGRQHGAAQAPDALPAPPAPPAGALAARPLLEKVARLDSSVGITVAEVRQLAGQAAAWLRDHPPGQPVAVEPRGCPTPGACSCIEPAPVAAPARGLVERVKARAGGDARAAIREVAVWLDLEGYNRAANDLREEVAQ